ncbi:MAG: hypothetical protein H0X66_15965 [Verrucomicrobia bacterium]|nr:hypothetical protein [Verrucomicrobiota bacterium]
MLEVIEKLLLLQDRDRKILRTEEELAHIEPERKALQEKASSTQSGLENAKLKVKQLETERKRLELEAETLKTKIEKYSIQQFETKKNEEFRALTKEIDNCKAAVIKLDDQQIELMEQIEAAQKEVATASKVAADAKKLVDDQLTQLAARETNLDKELEQLTANREELAAHVDDSTRARYERLLKHKGGSAVVGIQHGVCGGCRLKFPPQIVLSCKQDQEIVTCPNCGRILYYTKDMDLAVSD